MVKKILLVFFFVLILLNLFGCTTETGTSGGAVKGIKASPSNSPKVQTPEPNCDPSYPSVCIPSYPPDLDCGQIPYKRFKVLQPDPHGFDRDRDGTGCES